LGLLERPLGPARWGYYTTSDLYRAIREGKPHPGRTVIGFGANMLLAHADGARGRQALKELEFYAHADLFMNPLPRWQTSRCRSTQEPPSHHDRQILRTLAVGAHVFARRLWRWSSARVEDPSPSRRSMQRQERYAYVACPHRSRRYLDDRQLARIFHCRSGVRGWSSPSRSRCRRIRSRLGSREHGRVVFCPTQARHRRLVSPCIAGTPASLLR
jgi:hypothetical protein